MKGRSGAGSNLLRNCLTSLVLGGLLTNAPHAAPLLLDCSRDSGLPTVRELRGASPARMQLAAGSPRAWIEIDEDGRTVKIDGQVVSLTSPPRMARYGLWLSAEDPSLSIADSAGPETPLRLRVRVFCGDAASRASSTQSLAAVAASVAPGRVDASRLPALLAQIAGSTPRESDDLTAYAKHLAAQAQLMAGRSADAAEAFRQAERAWRALGPEDGGRAIAARAGWIEEMYSLGRYDDVIAATADAASGTDGAGAVAYYSSRLMNTRCVALKYLGRQDEALTCYGALTAKLKRLGEPLDRANALINLGSLQRDLGQLAAARESAEAADDVSASPEIERMPLVDVAGTRGRARLLLADLALRRGTIARAIEEYDSALADFDAAKAPRWRASTLLQMGSVYGRLGAYGDAYAMFARGVSLYRFHEAPARIASALLNVAAIEREHGNARLAAWMAAAAAGRYAALRTPTERQSARLLRARALVDAGDAELAARELSDEPMQPTAAYHLALAAIALARDRPDEAMVALRTAPDSTSLSDELDRDALLASATYARGDTQRAIDLAEATLARVNQATRASANTLLRQLLQQRGEPLRRQIVAWRLQKHEGAHDWDRLVRLLPYLPKSVHHITAHSTRSNEDFDEALARDLLLGNNNPASNPVLPSLLTRADAEQPRDLSPPTLARLQAALPSDAALFALLDGSDRAAALWITPTTVQLSTLPGTASIRAKTQRLNEDLAQPSTPVSKIAERARELSDALWPKRMPRHLGRVFVLAGPATESIPWSVLPGDGGAPLVESNDVSLVYLADDDDAPPPAKLTIAIAPLLQSRPTLLQPLNEAGNEPKLIASAYPQLTIETLDPSAGPIKPRLTDALSRSESVVHVAAHGTTDSDFLGRSGLWLEAPHRDGLPQFFSVLDLFDKGVQAQLVVLNACDLGGGQSRRANTLVFADTLVRLGARNVVAALWPVSDNAAKSWVPLFYAALDGRPDLDAGAALRQSQLGLLRIGHFRHPYYWASLVHVQRLRVPNDLR